MLSSIGSTRGTESAYISLRQENKLNQVDSDTENSGSLSVDQFKSAMQSLGPDTDGDGSVSKEEFVSERPGYVSEAQANQTWSLLDTGNSGSLSVDQFKSAMQSLGPDTDGDGSVSKEEFVSERPGYVSEAQANQDGSGTDLSDELVQSILQAIGKYTSSVSQPGISNENTTTLIC